MFRILVIGIVGTVCVGSFFSLVSVIVGGVVGNNLFSGASNAFGQRITPNTDMFGQRRFV